MNSLIVLLSYLEESRSKEDRDECLKAAKVYNRMGKMNHETYMSVTKYINKLYEEGKDGTST